MKIVGTRHKYVDVITWGLEEPISHIGLEFFGHIYLHSSLFSDVSVETAEDFYSGRIKVCEIDIEFSPQSELNAFLMASKASQKRKYDRKYFLWLTGVVLMKKILRKSIPSEIPEKWDAPKAYLCNEMLESLPKNLKLDYDERKAVTPIKLMEELELQYGPIKWNDASS